MFTPKLALSTVVTRLIRSIFDRKPPALKAFEENTMLTRQKHLLDHQNQRQRNIKFSAGWEKRIRDKMLENERKRTIRGYLNTLLG